MTLPNCPIEMYPHFNPSQGTMFFEESDEMCSEPTKFKVPFFLNRYGPKFQEWSVVAHETRPGHHSQAQGNSLADLHLQFIHQWFIHLFRSFCVTNLHYNTKIFLQECVNTSTAIAKG